MWRQNNVSVEKKWYLENPYGIPLHWCNDIIEFDTKEDAEKFKQGIEQIPFLATDVYYVVQHPRCPKEHINMSGLVPVANGDDIEIGGLVMKIYKLTIHENGVTKYYYIDALNEQDALNKGWVLYDAEDIYVSEVER